MLPPGDEERIMVFIGFMVIAEVDKCAVIHVTDADQFVVPVIEENCIRYIVTVVPETLTAPSVGPESGESAIPFAMLNSFQVMAIAHRIVTFMPSERHSPLRIAVIVVSMLPVAVVIVVPVVLPIMGTGGHRH